MSSIQYLAIRHQREQKLRLSLALCSALVMGLLLTALITAQAQTTPSSQITITLSSQGMTPSSATVSTGIVHLKVVNQSEMNNLTLRVTGAGGAVLREIAVPPKTQELATELELSAGQYSITEASNSAWRCTVTAQAPSSNSGSVPGSNP